MATPTPLISGQALSLAFRDETIVRTDVVGDLYHMSWAQDDQLFAGLCDGYGLPGNTAHTFNSRLLSISGTPPEIAFQEVVGYPFLEPATDAPRYYGFGTFALDGKIFQFLSTLNGTFVGGSGDTAVDTAFIGVKAIYSPDNGQTWCNHDGSSPVHWEEWSERSRDSMLFFEEEGQAFSLLSVLQMGRNYEANEDGYVYIYGTNGNAEGSMNALVMLRVEKEKLLERSAYQFFAGTSSDGAPIWSSDLAARVPVVRFASGWVNRKKFPHAWQPSLTYNAPLKLYMMANYGIGSLEDGDWFGKASYLGVWTAPQPWGPWTQIHEDASWAPGGDEKARCYAPQISPKWIAEDGKSFWLVWGDFQGVRGIPEADSKRLLELRSAGKKREATEFGADLILQYMPYYSFNTQRVDIVGAPSNG